MIFILQFIATLFLVCLVVYTFKLNNFKFTIVTIPVVTIISILVAAAIYLSLSHFWFYIPTGFLLGILTWNIYSVELNEEENYSLTSRLLITACSILFWPHVIVLMGMSYYFSKSINGDV